MIDDLAGMLTDEQAISVAAAYPLWDGNAIYDVGKRVRDGDKLYRRIQLQTAAETVPPHESPALWVRISLDEWPEWVQPTGAHDAYGNGDKTSHNDEHWISDMDGNVYEPGVYGWNKI